MLFPNTLLAKEDFSVWLQNVKYEAKSLGISDDTTADFTSHTIFLPNVIKQDRAQPEFITPFLDYFSKRVDDKKVAYGRALMLKHHELLTQIESKYGVPKQVLIAFWGMETQYGNVKGNIDVLSALATLAYEGRRSDFFRAQLLDAILMIELGYVDIERFKGSWAGAFGNMQFMPTTFMLYAVDGDADGVIDVVNSLPDAFASAAHYLASIGWKQNEPVMVEVKLPNDFDWQSAQMAVRKAPEEWSKLGVQVCVIETDTTDNLTSMNVDTPLGGDNQKTKRQVCDQEQTETTLNIKSSGAFPNVSGMASILLPQGWQGPAFMVFDNFDIIMQWNRSVNYALSVAQLAKLLNREPSILGGGFAESGALTYQQMLELQNRLNDLGFDAGVADGLPGLQTQAAVRSYQLEQQLPADGYASPSFYQRLLLH
ncbi:lytic murein transglycosylase [Methylotenera mobilis]|uniref:lytic murein transglycosylase n=1 Tax=Methylotenera mobilis TaxID=359408 RepID=UPI000366A2F1|nr:MAG: lytic murein transglycosylase [Methylotenera sp.]